MRRPVLTLLLLALALPAVSAVWAYTTATVRTSGNGAFRVVAAQPAAGERPYVYCSAADVTLSQRDSDTMPVTCYNGLAHAVTLSISYSYSPSAQRPPSFSPGSPFSLTVPANGQATATLGVTTPPNRTRSTYTISYTVSTSGTQGVEVSGIGFTSILDVT
ncbi:MAG: hypothetical protein AVDCRST_MAG77-2849 [uncultured Chloroflexi bacterium]|uniref:Uncharacterized protein n=1 Tax=uncultured Chloroflexota bacterium TaxID=166587 RepID=A0A6J4IYT7_9CHLR|nr:MAG: hypothetical protein AVDCRST_MAG77-2849 [uncultured Chloroflexota bacterium]